MGRRLEFVALVKQRGTIPVHALQAGTINGAELLEWQDYVGSITNVAVCAHSRGDTPP